jgi:hydrogenase 3 maturation protease
MFEESLRMRLKSVKRLLVLGIGNELEGDDGAGIVLARRLKKDWGMSGRLCALEVGLAPENFISAIRGFDPSHILVVDAADMGLSPGSARIVEKSEIAGLAVSTHGLSLSFLIDYLEKELGVTIIVVGVQPLRVGLPKRISKSVIETLDSLEKMLSNILRPGLDAGRSR